MPNNSPNGCRRRALVFREVRLRVVEELIDSGRGLDGVWNGAVHTRTTGDVDRVLGAAWHAACLVLLPLLGLMTLD